MALNPEDMQQLLPSSSQEAAVSTSQTVDATIDKTLVTLMSKIAGADIDRDDQRVMKMNGLLYWRNSSSFHTLVTEVCQSYIKQSSIFSTKTALAQRILVYLGQPAPLGGKEHSSIILEIINVIELMVQYYKDLDAENEKNSIHQIAKHIGFSLRPTVDDIASDSIFFAYIHLAIKPKMQFTSLDKTDYEHFTARQLWIFISLASMKNMYMQVPVLKPKNNLAWFDVLYHWSKEGRLDDTHRQLIAASFNQATVNLSIQENDSRSKSIDTLLDFINLRLLMSTPTRQVDNGRLFDNIIAVFNDAWAPVMLDIFNHLTLTQYQAFWDILCLKHRTLEKPHPLLTTLAQTSFWQALLSTGNQWIMPVVGTSTESNNLLTNCLPQLLYDDLTETSSSTTTQALHGDKGIIRTIWPLVLTTPQLRVWIPSLLRFPTTTSEKNTWPSFVLETLLSQETKRASPNTTRSTTITMRGLVNSLMDADLLQLLDKQAILAIGDILAEAQRLKCISAVEIAAAQAFISKLTLALVSWGHYQKVRVWVSLGVITWPVLTPLIRDHKLLLLPGDDAPQLILSLLYTVQSSQLMPQPIFAHMVSLLWTDETYAAHRIWLVATLQSFDSQEPNHMGVVPTAQLNQDFFEDSLVLRLTESYTSETYQCFYDWWDRHKDDANILSTLSHERLSWLVGTLIIGRLLPYALQKDVLYAYGHHLLPTQTFWMYVYQQSNNKHMLFDLLISITHCEALKKILTTPYIKSHDKDLTFLDIIFNGIKKHKYEEYTYLDKLIYETCKGLEKYETLEIVILLLSDARMIYYLNSIEKIIELFNLLIESEKYNEYRKKYVTGLITNAWRLLCSSITNQQLIDVLNSQSLSKRNHVIELIYHQCNIGLQAVLENMFLRFGASMWSPYSLRTALEKMVAYRYNLTAFRLLLSFMDPYSIQLQYRSHPLRRLVDQGDARDLPYLKAIFERYRQLHGDTDLTIPARDELVLGFIYYCESPLFIATKIKKGVFSTNSLLEYAVASKANTIIVRWLFNLTQNIWDQILFEGNRFVLFDIMINGDNIIETIWDCYIKTTQSNRELLTFVIIQLIQNENISFKRIINAVFQDKFFNKLYLGENYFIINRAVQQYNVNHNNLALMSDNDLDRLLDMAQYLSQREYSGYNILMMAARYQASQDERFREAYAGSMSPRDFFTFMDLMIQEKNLRAQPLAKWIALTKQQPILQNNIAEYFILSKNDDITPMMQGENGLEEWMIALGTVDPAFQSQIDEYLRHSESSSLSLSSLITALASHTALSCQSRAILQDIVAEANTMTEAVMTGYTGASTDAKLGTTHATKASHWAKRLGQLATDAGIQIAAPSRLNTKTKSHPATMVPVTSCSTALYPQTSSGSGPDSAPTRLLTHRNSQ